MAFSSKFGFTSSITILRPKTRSDPHSTRPVIDRTNAERITVPFLVSLQPSTSTEAAESRAQVVTLWRLLTPAGKDLDLRPTDQVESGLMILDVVGDVQRWPHPMKPGGVHHVEVMLERVSN